VKEVKGDVKEIKSEIERNSMYRVHNHMYFSQLITMVVDANIQNTLKIIKDDQLGSYEFQFCLITTTQ
jgi:hypothetical protein